MTSTTQVPCGEGASKSERRSTRIYAKSNENADVDASACGLYAFRVVEPTDQSYVRTVASIEEQLSLVGGIRRYPPTSTTAAARGPCSRRHSVGTTHVGDLEGARRCHEWISERFDEEGRLGEQFAANCETLRTFENGRPMGPPARTLRGRTHVRRAVDCARIF